MGKDIFLLRSTFLTLDQDRLPHFLHLINNNSCKHARFSRETLRLLLSIAVCSSAFIALRKLTIGSNRDLQQIFLAHIELFSNCVIFLTTSHRKTCSSCSFTMVASCWKILPSSTIVDSIVSIVFALSLMYASCCSTSCIVVWSPEAPPSMDIATEPLRPNPERCSSMRRTDPATDVKGSLAVHRQKYSI